MKTTIVFASEQLKIYTATFDQEICTFRNFQQSEEKKYRKYSPCQKKTEKLEVFYSNMQTNQLTKK